ncbi:Ulp1 family isopeptidase [Bradyrhizobium sp. 2S1]|uniref:Ulp1 family isopeptidase n=1 Tax=Bradyrhizobium sp. 2S1 TaxID=1404429 RepID=UPI001CD0C6B3|nr:Ulp1 family isopeptidase [Bradyrhizobium sp. 2S1]MCK7667313.1 C48 family peptidase [Bradyrhizobium sp. 2S1]
MDRHNYDPTNVTASSQVQHDLLQEQQAGQAGQEAFEQQLHEAREADTAMPDRGTPPNVSSDGQQSPEEPIGALAGSNLLPSEKVLIKDGHDTAELRPTNRPRTPDNPQGVAIERQLSEVANSVGGGGAIPAASAPQPAQLTLVSIAGTKRKQPLYSKDALVVLGFREALIGGKLAESFVQRIVGPLLSFGRWLCVNNKTGIVARLDNNSLTDGGDLFQYNGNRDLILALDHLRTWRSTGRVPHAAPVRKRQKASTVYPHVSGCDRELISEVAQGVIASRKLKDVVANGYTRNLNRLANDLGERGLSLVGSNDAFLLAHAKEIFKGDKLMRTAVGALREHRAPNAPGASSVGERPPLPPADGDEGLIKGAISHAFESNKLSSTTVKSYDWALRKFSRELGLYGDSLSALNHVALRVYADRLFRKDGGKMALDGGLKALREYRQAKASSPSGEGASGAGGSQQGAGEATQSPMVDVDPEELRQLLDDEADEPPIMADDPALLPPEQELLEETQGPRDHQSGPLSALEPSVRDDHAPDHAESFPDLSGHHDLQQAAHELMGALDRSNLLPSEEVLVNDEHDTAELRPAKRPRNLDNPHGLASERQLSEIANSNGGGGAMPAASALQPAQSAGVLKGRSKQPLYSEDARLISGLEKALIKGNSAKRTAQNYVHSLRSFGRWLFANNKDPIAARLDDQSLIDDAREAIEKGHNRGLRPAIDHLRTFQSTGGVVPITGRAELNPHPQDVALIKEYKNEAATVTGRVYAVSLRSFGHYLRENNKKGIAARLSGNTLDEDVKRYRKDAGGDPNIGAALAHLRKSQAGAKAMEFERYISPVPDPEDAALMEPMPVGGAAAQHSASQRAFSWPEELLPAVGHDQDLLLGLMDEPGPSSSLEPAARHDQSSDPGESIRPLNWGYDRQQFPDESMGALARSNLLPSEEVLINDEHDTAELRPAKRPRPLDNLHGLAGERQLSEIANSGGRLLTSAPTHQLGASPWQAQPMMQASGHEDATAPHAVATYVGGAAAQHSAPQGAVSRPLVLPEGYDQDLRLMVEDGPPWSGVPPEQAQEIVQAGQQEPARSTSTWSPQMPLDFDWSMWPTLEAASAHSARAPSDIEGGLEAAVHPNPPAPFELRDNAWSPAPDFPPPFAGPVPGHHQGVRQPGSPQGLSPAPAFSDDEALAWLREELARRQMQEPASPSTSRAPSDTYGGLESFVDLDAATPSELRDDAHFAPAPAAGARSDTYRGFPLVDLTAATPSESRDDANSVRPFPSTSADAQIRALDPTASSHGHGLVLEDTEWLGDEHIDRDYRLQELDLRRNHPDLAARTRFVNPLIVLNYLRSNDDGVVLTEFQRIVGDDNGNDTADFLFLPVINANPEDPNSLGNHWSLLFVDRRDRGRPVAYHYDSYGGLNNKDADHLAGRLHLRLERAGMAQQRNGYDCGVFVVDGTRALVRQLEQGREPDLLNLSNVVANRQALQNRLRG